VCEVARHVPGVFSLSKLPVGQHFAAFEQPKLFVGEMRSAFKSRRDNCSR
jgi:hypothetical protein